MQTPNNVKVAFPKKIVYKFKDRCQPEDLKPGYFVDILSIQNMIAVSDTPDISADEEGTSFLILSAGTELNIQTGNLHWSLCLVSKNGHLFNLNSRNPVGADKAEIFRAAVPLPLP